MLLVLWSLLIAVGPALADTQAWKLVQSNTIAGTQTIYISKDALRIENPNAGIVIFSKQPYDVVRIANAKTRCYKEMDRRQALKIMKGMQLLLSVVEPVSAPWGPSRPATLNGLKALIYHSEDPGHTNWRNFWVLQEPKVPRSVAQMICASSGMPDEFGIPLQMQQSATSEMKELDLSAGIKSQSAYVFQTQLVKQMPVPDQLLVCPKSYKRTDDVALVMTNSTGWASLKEMSKSPEFLFKSSDQQLGKLKPGPAKKSPKGNH